jgi:hypothetical protein
MHGLVASAFFSVMLLAAALMLGLPSQRVGQAGAGEGDQLPPVESTQSPAAIPSNGAASVARICDALAAAAGENDLPVDFFARLIWQESRFDPTASASRRARRGTVHAGDRERARHRQVAGIPGVGEIATDYEPASDQGPTWAASEANLRDHAVRLRNRRRRYRLRRSCDGYDKASSSNQPDQFYPPLLPRPFLTSPSGLQTAGLPRILLSLSFSQGGKRNE